MPQFCPIAKAAEIVCEKWSLLIMREILMGGSRFNVLQRGLGDISPTILNKRLKLLVDQGLVAKRKISGQKGYEYFPTSCGQELLPILVDIGKWGMRWARDGMPDEDLDLELLMLYLERSIDSSHLPGRQTIVRFHFVDMKKNNKWWLIIGMDSIETCIRDPGKEVDIYIDVDLRTMIEIWMGDISYSLALKKDQIRIQGPASLTRNVSKWLKNSIFHGIPAASRISAGLG